MTEITTSAGTHGGRRYTTETITDIGPTVTPPPSYAEDTDVKTARLLNQAFDADFHSDLTEVGLPHDIRNEIKANGVFTKELFARSFVRAEI